MATASTALSTPSSRHRCGHLCRPLAHRRCAGHCPRGVVDPLPGRLQDDTHRALFCVTRRRGGRCCSQRRLACLDTPRATACGVVDPLPGRLQDDTHPRATARGWALFCVSGHRGHRCCSLRHLAYYYPTTPPPPRRHPSREQLLVGGHSLCHHVWGASATDDG